MNTDGEDRLIKRVEQLHDKLDEHSSETRDRWEEHEKEHRLHDREHSVLGQWQVTTDERLRAGAGTMQEIKTRIKPISATVVASMVIAIIGFPVAAALWVRDGLDEKADKAVVPRIETKAEKTDVERLNVKIDALTVTLAHMIDKLQNPKGKP